MISADWYDYAALAMQQRPVAKPCAAAIAKASNVHLPSPSSINKMHEETVKCPCQVLREEFAHEMEI